MSTIDHLLALVDEMEKYKTSDELTSHQQEVLSSSIGHIQDVLEWRYDTDYEIEDILTDTFYYKGFTGAVLLDEDGFYHLELVEDSLGREGSIKAEDKQQLLYKFMRLVDDLERSDREHLLRLFMEGRSS